jgi:hypothetical protein
LAGRDAAAATPFAQDHPIIGCHHFVMGWLVAMAAPEYRPRV